MLFDWSNYMIKTVNVVAAIICDNYEHKTRVFATQRGYGDFEDG